MQALVTSYLTFLLTISSPSAKIVVQKFMREPPDQTAAEGEHVTLPCRVENKVGPLQWTRDDFGLGLNRNLKGFERYRMSGSDEEGDYTLDIDQVTLEDDAKFQCQVGAAPGVAPVRSRYATLTVTVKPEPPIILQGDEIRTQEDRVISLECVSRGGKPEPEITWLDNWNSPIKHHIETIVETLPDGKRKNTRSILKVVVKREHHNTSLTCEAQNSAESVPQSTKVRVMVEFAPAVTLERRPAVVREGDTAMFRCAAEANPASLSYRWFLGQQEMAGEEDGSLLVLPGLNRTSAGKIVKCQVSNSIGKSEETYSLEIYYSPEFLKRPGQLSGDAGQEVLLQCLADSNPPPSYKWFRNGNLEMVIGYTSNLTIFISPDTVGLYTCLVGVKGYKQIQASGSVQQRGPPVLQKNPESSVQYGSVGETVQVLCQGRAEPQVDAVLWRYKDFPLNTRNKHYQVINKKKKDKIASTLVIRNAALADFGVYNCSVRNSYGQDFQLIEIVRKEDTTLLLSLVVVICGAILVMGSLMVALHCRKVRHKHCQDKEQEPVWPTQTDSTAKNLSQSELNGNGNGVANFNGKENVTFQKVPCIPLSMYSSDSQVMETETPDLYSGYNGSLPYPPPPPPVGGALNISNPRYSAMYRNTLLRYSPTEPQTVSSPLSSVRSLSSPYHSIRTQQQQQQQQQQQHHQQQQQFIQAQDGLGNGRLATHV